METLKIVILAVMLLLSLVPEVLAAPSWLATARYVKYDQLFSWSGKTATESMVWNITALSNGLADLQVTSYSYNVTNGQVNVFPVGENWTVDTETREITQSTTGVTGLKNPFWIETSASTGSTIDAYFGAMATIEGPDTIQALGQSISCWEVSLTWPTSTMQRWYDPATGIVLRIDTSMSRDGINMNVQEKAAASNIAMIGTGSTGGWLSLWPYIAGLTLLGIGAGVTALHFRRRSTKFLRG